MTNKTATQTSTVETSWTPEELLLIPKVDPHYVMPIELSQHIQRDVAERKPILLTGHAGTGKTSIIQQLAAYIKQPFIRVNMNGQTTISDFVGYNTVINGNVEFIYGVLPLALKHGYWLCVDELDSAGPEILTVLNPVTEIGGQLMLKEKGCEIIPPHRAFRIFGTANTVGCMEEFRHIYQGTNQMNTALLDRFRTYRVDYLPSDKEVDVLVGKVPACPRKAAEGLVELANQIRSGFASQNLERTFSIRALIDLAEMLVRLRGIEIAKKEGQRMDQKGIMAKAVDLCIGSKVSQKDAMTISDIASRIAIV